MMTVSKTFFEVVEDLGNSRTGNGGKAFMFQVHWLFPLARALSGNVDEEMQVRDYSV